MPGKIISLDEAEAAFGKITEAAALNINTLQDCINKSVKVIMVQIINGEAAILDNNRSPLFPPDIKIDNNIVFTVFDIDIVNQIVLEAKSSEVMVEKRNEIVTIRSGGRVLEFGAPCPPYCG